MTDLSYPFDWEAHAAQQLARQEEEAAADAARIEKENNPRHPLDPELVKVEYPDPKRNWPGEQQLGLYYRQDIPQNEMILYLQTFWDIRCIVWEGLLMIDLGIEYATYDPGDWVVLEDTKRRGGYPLSNAEFLRRFVRKEG